MSLGNKDGLYFKTHFKRVNNMNKRKLDTDRINKLKEKIESDIIDNIGPRQLYQTELYDDMSGG